MEEFLPVSVTPAGRPFLAFRYLAPAGWNVPALPVETPEFENPNYHELLSLAVDPGGATFSVTVRPAYASGPVSQWADWACAHEQYHLLESHAVEIAGLSALLYDVRQPAQPEPVVLRILFLEDGGRFYTVTAAAPAPRWGEVEWFLDNMIGTFRLEEPRGPSAPLHAAEEAAATTPASVALAETAASLDPADEVNRRLAESGAGQVPAILETNLAERFARLASATLDTGFRVPFGWHVLDDGRRVLIFDAPGRVQINLQLRGVPEGRAALLDALAAEAAAAHPAAERTRLELAGIPLLLLRPVTVDGRELTQTYLAAAAPGRPEGAVLARVTAAESDLVFALNTAEVILTALEDARPEWARRIDELAGEGNYAAAEALILASIPHLGAYSQAAYIHERRCLAALAAGDLDEARAAYAAAVGWLDQYAASATSGGEGTALSAERKRRIIVLDRALDRATATAG